MFTFGFSLGTVSSLTTARILRITPQKLQEPICQKCLLIRHKSMRFVKIKRLRGAFHRDGRGGRKSNSVPPKLPELVVVAPTSFAESRQPLGLKRHRGSCRNAY